MLNTSSIAEQVEKVLAFLQDIAALKSMKQYDEAVELIFSQLNSLVKEKKKTLTPDAFYRAVIELKASPEKLFFIFFLISERIMLCLLTKRRTCINQLVISLKLSTELLEPAKNEDISFLISRSLLDIARAVPPEVWKTGAFDDFIETLYAANLFEGAEQLQKDRERNHVASKKGFPANLFYSELRDKETSRINKKQNDPDVRQDTFQFRDISEENFS